MSGRRNYSLFCVQGSEFCVQGSGLKSKANLRDSLSTESLARVKFAESLATGRIEKDDLSGNEDCQNACSLAGRAVAEAVRIASTASLSPPRESDQFRISVCASEILAHPPPPFGVPSNVTA